MCTYRYLSRQCDVGGMENTQINETKQDNPEADPYKYVQMICCQKCKEKNKQQTKNKQT